MNSGFLNLYKPQGLTSQQVVGRVRRLTGIKRVGHGGTLDPLAEGILPIAVGSATRLLRWANLSPKVYEAWVRVGTTTLTGDAQGRVTGRSRRWPWDEGALNAASRWLVGPIWQVPPQVAALKVGGERQYRAVQQGRVVWPSPRRVTVDVIDQIALTPDGFRFRCQVSAGTYVRSLVRDWGYLLGVAAHLERLTRVRVGPFEISQALTLGELATAQGDWPRLIWAWTAVLNLPVVELDQREWGFVLHGDKRGLAKLKDWSRGPGAVALTFGGRLVAVAEGPDWHYAAVFEEGL